jgi:hypothetical protein
MSACERGSVNIPPKAAHPEGMAEGSLEHLAQRPHGYPIEVKSRLIFLFRTGRRKPCIDWK